MIQQLDLTEGVWAFSLHKEEPSVHVICEDTCRLPSTVQEEKKSPVTDERSAGYLTDPHRFEGYAVYRREVDLTDSPEESVCTLVLERTRTSRLYVDGVYVGTQNSLCTEHRYDITKYAGAVREITLVIDNVTCPVSGGHMTSPDTQTNWLGILGKIAVEWLGKNRLECVKITPLAEEERIVVSGRLRENKPLVVTAGVEGYPLRTYQLTPEHPTFSYEMPKAIRWTEHRPLTYDLYLCSSEDRQYITFGMRTFASVGRELRLNDEKIFLRGKHDGMIFPLTGAAPMDKDSWMKVMTQAKAYGINHYRFHTCCPPEAAFEAADELGIFMEPELPFWGTVEEELTPGQEYLVEEGYRILDSFANHPSFFALSLGNELWGSKERLNSILGDYKAYDARPLYTQGSNNFQFWPSILENEDFFVGVRFSKNRLFRGSYAMCDAPQGHIQTETPNANYNYDALISPKMAEGETGTSGTIAIQYGTGVKYVSVDADSGVTAPTVPVISHEVGQYFTYPNYEELAKYTGVLKPYNLEIFRERLEEKGLGHLSDAYFRASGALAVQCYKNEIETALRSRELSGFQLLDIQDFTGQGTALVGVLDSFMEDKGLIDGEHWRQFCSDRVLLLCLSTFVEEAGGVMEIPVRLWNYSAHAVRDLRLCITLSVDGEVLLRQDIFAEGTYGRGLHDVACVEVTLPMLTMSKMATLTVAGAGVENSYELWIAPRTEEDSVSEVCDLLVTGDYSEAREALLRGERVLLMTNRISEEHSLPGTYCTDFWNYPMFRSISESMERPVPVGTLGLLIDEKHPALASFATKTYSTPQWYDIVSTSRPIVLDGQSVNPIVRTIDNCERNHSLGTILECRVEEGTLLVCTSPLERAQSLSEQHLRTSLIRYAKSSFFSPKDTMELTVLDSIFLIG